ncbi:helix-turn-helix domain-containing protein [Runella sp. MFBS21]|uniref:helix-turn-helix domain-containing protein n=1 Tax=Runella sp. MFBS21 TaxID=3034018 RepID=UPI0023F8FC01|nr:helix-turn-helix domain-containing protein [Runella sp. MFBS21]MDF7817338.1 helix-turn-helix domain-containing protein [Runella sp. MFBS21]
MMTDKVFIEKLNKLIDDNLDNPSLTIDSICEQLGMSRSRLHRLLKEESELSATLYIRRRKLLKARDLLQNTDLRISEIGDMVGLVNPQNFSTYFIQEFKLSPSDFRKQQIQQSIQAEALSLQEEVPTVIMASSVPKRLLLSSISLKRNWIYVFLGITFLTAITVLFFWMGRESTSPQPAKNSLAILPFTNLGTTDTDPVLDGVMSELHTSLSLIKNLKVIARSSSDQYKNTKKSIWKIGDELNVGNVLRGAILKTNDQIQIKLEMIDTQNDIRLWSKTYNGAYKDIFQLTDQIVKEVAAQLKLTVNALANEKHTRSPEAYNIMVQGRQLLVSRMDEDLLASIVRFDRALKIDSTFAEAYALKAFAYHLLRGSNKMEASKLDELTKKNALKAIQFEAANSSAYGVLGSLYYATYQWDASENAYQIALQHNPNNADIYHWYGLLMRTTGKLDKAIECSSQAIALAPLHPIMLSAHIINCSLASRGEEAQVGIEAGQTLFDKSFSFKMSIALYWVAQGDYPQAVSAFEEAIRLNPDDKGQIPILIYCEAKRGNTQKARQYLQTLADTPRAYYERAVVYAGLNQPDSSLINLKKAADGGYLYRDTKVMAPFKPYRSHPIFKSVMRQFNLPQ